VEGWVSAVVGALDDVLVAMIHDEEGATLVKKQTL
jgi:hypothetical protein